MVLTIQSKGGNNGKLVVLDLEESGGQIGEKLFALLSPNQKKELSQFIHDYEAGNLPADVSYAASFQEQQNKPDQS